MSTVAGLMLLAVAGQGMPDMGGKAQIAAMEKMSFCLGEWEGSGWASVGGRKSEFKSTEVVTKEAGGTIFAVRGKHWVEIPGRDPLIIHDAFGMISFDQNSKKFEINSHLATGATGKFEIQVVDSGYSMSHPARTEPPTSMKPSLRRTHGLKKAMK
ncbi:MAG: hypothetical protein R2688_03345 [Fimbriimonadaceae bacterium]